MGTDGFFVPRKLFFGFQFCIGNRPFLTPEIFYIDGWMDGWVMGDGWMDGWMDGWVGKYLFLFCLFLGNYFIYDANCFHAP